MGAGNYAASEEHQTEDLAFSESGVDLSLIEWMLELTPAERLAAAQDMIDTVWMLRESESA